MIVRFSKCDFWIPEKILGRSSKKYVSKKYFFETNVFFGKTSKNIFRDKKMCEKKSYEKVNEKRKFQNFDFFEKKKPTF